MLSVARARALTALLAVGVTASAGCITPATEVLCVVGTDVPPEVPLQIRAAARFGAVTISELEFDHAWVRSPGDGGSGAANVFGSFAIVPPRGTTDETLVTVLVEGVGPDFTLRRTARFRIVPGVTSTVSFFLTGQCLQPATGCTEVPSAQCTVQQSCEERGQTCGDDGRCVDVMTMPHPGDLRDAGFDARFQEVPTPPVDAGTDATVDACGPGAACCPDAGACGPGEVCTTRGTCSVCGAGHDCCEDGQACASGQVCTSAGCAACGGAGQPCCADGSCGGGSLCQGGACVACGAAGQPCCAGDACDAGSRCNGGSCVACGGNGQSCCGSNQCNAGLGCSGGSCTCLATQTLCGGAVPCCAPNTCATLVSDNMRHCCRVIGQPCTVSNDCCGTSICWNFGGSVGRQCKAP